MSTADPTQLARQLHDAAEALARCLATDVRIEPVQGIMPIVRTVVLLEQIAGELGRAAISVDEPAAAAARRAADQFVIARRELTTVARRLLDVTRVTRGRDPGPPRPVA